MCADAISQNVTVTALHQQVSSDDALHEASDTLQWNEATTAAEAAHFHTQCLESQVAELQQHVTAYNVLGQSNVTFRQRLAKVLAECAATEQSRVTEELAIRQDAFTFKKGFEQTLKKTLRELDATYLSRTYGKMKLESKVRGERWERWLGRRRVLLGVAYAYLLCYFWIQCTFVG